jgi:hypothetical protein
MLLRPVVLKIGVIKSPAQLTGKPDQDEPLLRCCKWRHIAQSPAADARPPV